MLKYALAILCWTGVVWAQAGAPTPDLPAWLTPFSGVAASTSSSNGLAEMSYRVDAKADEISAHYRQLLTAAGVTFMSNFDGVGTSMRAALPECDLLVKIRDLDPGAAVKVTCATKTANSGSNGSGAAVVVPSGSVPGRNWASTGAAHPALRSAEEIKRYNEDRAREIQEKKEVWERESQARMSQYDKPVSREQSARVAYRHDDAPPLIWPSWLKAVPGTTTPDPVEGVDQSKSKYLRMAYKTTAPMTTIRQFYQDSLKTNGFRILRSSIGTGSTSAGVQQNASGEVEAYRPEGDQINPPSTNINIYYHRSYLNEPITVNIRVTVIGSFGR